MDANGQDMHLGRAPSGRVALGCEGAGRVELVREPGALGLAEPDAVEEHLEGRVDALEAQKPAAACRRGREGERPPVLSRRVLVRDRGRVNGEGVGHIRVGGPAVGRRARDALELPAVRDAHAVPGRVVEARGLEARRPRGGGRAAEGPLAVERHGDGVGLEVGPGREGPQVRRLVGEPGHGGTFRRRSHAAPSLVGKRLPVEGPPRNQRLASRPRLPGRKSLRVFGSMKIR